MNIDPQTRLAELQNWLQSLPAELELDLATLVPASSDASFRRYYRLHAGARALIAMDAPPEHENNHAFVQVDRLLVEAGLNVPRILAQDLERGFMLLTDLGRQTYYQCIQDGLDDAPLQRLYRDALTALVRMQHASVLGLPAYDSARFTDELALFPEWYVRRHRGAVLDDTGKNGLQQIFDLLARNGACSRPVLVHRDFHSPNLMVCDQAECGPNPGIIDFQDALAGPPAYDLASLIMDARTTWDEPQQLDWAVRYWEMAREARLPVDTDFADFHRHYEWIGLQRNLRILGVFARLNHRDGKAHYLDHMPRVNQYVRQVAARYDVFTPLRRLLDRLDDNPPTVGFTF